MFIGGGTNLLDLMKGGMMQPMTLVDITRIEAMNGVTTLPGTGCAALEGNNRMHAILGANPQCIATNPSDMSVALAALDAVVRVSGPQGERTIPFAEFHRLPGERPDLDTTLAPGELITAVDLPPPLFARHSKYLKVRDRASYAFALVSVAAALQMDSNTVTSARIALGGVAHKPWHAAALAV
ncbi:Periplasmic aromatic aldehyde oxidoreductase, FAD binding subunit YagS [Candidatus Paraburkholderia calva]|nr:Periplasmic aromatic aldehyde oxidoreductase, FAD binding subunit YagS [Candidatus Paraburkholderia calva]